MPGLVPGIQGSIAASQGSTQTAAAMPYYVYLLASRRNRTLYVGVTKTWCFASMSIVRVSSRGAPSAAV